MNFKRVWAMPNSETFSTVSVDPFARNRKEATWTNDLNPNTSAEYHMDAVEFLKHLSEKGVHADLLIFDPPYSPRQISECYKGIGLKVGMKDTQMSRLHAAVRDAALPVLTSDAIVISCGWNSAGMGINRGFELEEILLVCHGGGHNDTIVTVERMVPENKLC